MPGNWPTFESSTRLLRRLTDTCEFQGFVATKDWALKGHNMFFDSRKHVWWGFLRDSYKWFTVVLARLNCQTHVISSRVILPFVNCWVTKTYVVDFPISFEHYYFDTGSRLAGVQKSVGQIFCDLDILWPWTTNFFLPSTYNVCLPKHGDLVVAIEQLRNMTFQTHANTDIMGWHCYTPFSDKSL